MMSKDYPPYLDYPKPYKPMTNGDRIRAMSDEELARKTFMWATAIASLANPHATLEGDYESDMREWLKQPVEESNDTD